MVNNFFLKKISYYLEINDFFIISDYIKKMYNEMLNIIGYNSKIISGKIFVYKKIFNKFIS